MTETPALDAVIVAIFNPFEAALAEYKKHYSSIVYDLTDPDQEKQARTDRLAIGKKISELDVIHKKTKEPLKAQVDMLDGERKRIKDGLSEVRDSIKDQITKHEAAIQARQDALLRKVEEIKNIAVFATPGTVEELEFRLDRLTKIETTVNPENFEEHEANAMLAVRNAMATIRADLAAAKEREKLEAENKKLRDQAEANELREREARRIKDAGEESRNKAAREIEERQAAEQKRIDKEKKKLQKESDRLALEESQRKAAEEKAAADQLLRDADQEHRAEINRAAVGKLMALGHVTEEQARKIVTAIVKRQIPNINLVY